MLVKLLNLLFLAGIAFSQGGWQNYVDNNLVGDRLGNNGAILGHDGAIWAKSEGFKISDDEAKEIVNRFKSPSRDPLVVGGQRYLILKGDDAEIIGKKGGGGFAAAKTTTAIVLATYDERTQPGTLYTAVMKLADFFIEQGH